MAGTGLTEAEREKKPERKGHGEEGGSCVGDAQALRERPRTRQGGAMRAGDRRGERVTSWRRL